MDKIKAMTIENNDNFLMYKIDCDCGSNDHITTIEIEYDKEYKFTNLTFYKEMDWFPKDIEFFTRFYERIVCALKVLFTGIIKVDAEVVISDKETVQALIEILQKIDHEKNNLV